MEQPLVSVLMPMRNAAQYVAEAVTSITEQSYRALEVVVIDDGSSDDSAAIVHGLGDPRVRVLPGPQQGIAAAFNSGLAAALGNIVMRCDADDRFPPGRIERQVQFLKDHAEYGAVCGAYRSITPAGALAAELAVERASGEVTDLLLHGETPTHLCTFAIRIEPLRRLAGCRAAFVTAEDIDLQLRLAEVCRVYFSHELTYDYRLHDASITHRQGNSQRAFFEQLARDCRAQRAQGHPDCVSLGEIPAPPEDDGAAKSSTDHLRGHLLAQAWRYHATGRRFSAINFGMRALATEPRALQTWKSLFALALKRSGSSNAP